MKIKHISIIICLLFLPSLTAKAIPARGNSVLLYQPDGSSFLARLVGDEYQHFLLTPSGNAVVRDSDGWYCYQTFNADGTRVNSHVHVGPDASSSVLLASSSIPFEQINARAMEKRSRLFSGQINPMRRFAARHNIDFREPATKSKVPPVKHGLVILANFKDVQFQHSRTEFVNMLTKQGYSVNGATGCAKEYFDAQFNGGVEFHFDVSELVTVKNNRSYYGANDPNNDDQDIRPEEMIVEACCLADPYIDFSLYDDDGDGVVDNVFVFFAGGDEAQYAGDECIWSHAWALKSGAGITLRLDGVLIDSYACTSELRTSEYTSDRLGNIGAKAFAMSAIGTFCHEYSHTMGLPDLYDTNYSEDGESDALWGATSLMDAGGYNNDGNTPPYYNAIEREIMGLTEPEPVNTGTLSLPAISSSNRCLKVGSKNDGEYYLLECRINTGWDAYIGGKGLLVYHVDKSMNQVSVEGRSYSALALWEDINCVNANSRHCCADLLEANPSANGKHPIRDGLSADIFFPYSSYKSISPDGARKFTFWSGEIADVAVNNITVSGNAVSMSVIGSGFVELPPTVKNLNAARFQDAAIVTLQASRAFEGECRLNYGVSGSSSYKDLLLKPYEPGYYAVVLEGLKPKTSYEVKASFILGDLEGDQLSLKFMTMSVTDPSYPFISFKDVTRTADGIFPKGSRIPLRLGGISEYDSVSWYFDDEEINVAGDCYYSLSRSGQLKADVVYKDGSHEYIVKDLIVK